MKYVEIILRVLMVAGIVFAIWATLTNRKPRNTNNRVASARVTLEEKLVRLKECGFELAAPFTVNDLLESWDRSEYEEPGWYTVIYALAMTEEQEPWRPHCANLFLLDTECVEDHGAYKAVAEEFVRISQGSLQLEDIEDYVDIEAGKTWLSFKYKNEEVRIDCKVSNDWLDRDIFSEFSALLKKADPAKKFIIFSIDQSVMIGCVSEAQLVKLMALDAGFEEL